MNPLRSLKGIFLGATSVALISGCSGWGNTSDLQRWVDEKLSQQKVRIEPLPEFKPFETYLYAASDLRSPFVPPSGVGPAEQATQVASNGIAPDFNRPREPLEEAPLDSLRMVGTLGQGGESWALVRNVDGTIHRVRPGNYVGQNHGKIESISEYEVQLTEIIPDGLGGWQEREATLALSE